MGPKTDKKRRTYFGRSSGEVLLGLASVAVLVIVIVTASALSPSKPAPRLSGLGQTSDTQSDQFYEQAVEALRSGDETAALDLAARALSLNPNNREAATLVVRLRNPSATSSSSGDTKQSGGGPSSEATAQATPDDRAFDSRVSDIAKLLPDRFEGYGIGSVVKSTSDADVSGVPVVRGRASNIAWAVHDRGSRAAAKDFLSKTSRVLFPVGSSSVTVAGVPAYFGTDGTQLASISYTRGRYAFEVVVTADGVSPTALKTLALTAAEAFADAP